MGACNFYTKGKGRTMGEAYRFACERAREEYGNDSYNGTISTTRGVADLTSSWKASKKSLDDFINDKADGGGKWGNAYGICVKEPKGNTNKIKTEVIHSVSTGTKKWVLVYVISDRDGEIATRPTKGEAVTLARAYTEKNQLTTYVKMEKRLDKGKTIVAEINYKKSTNESEGEYVFWGTAAE